jgi:flagellar hook assembly protein FlgD
VVVDFVKAVLPQDERNDNKNGEVAFSYSFNGNLISSLLEKDMNFKNSTVKTWPNPFRDSVMIQFELIKSGKVEILIFDLAGIQIDRIDAGILQSGIHAVKWDGINRNGKVVRKGTYNCVIITPDGKISQKLILT